jgi:hypothetical protein
MKLSTVCSISIENVWNCASTPCISSWYVAELSIGMVLALPFAGSVAVMTAVPSSEV